MQTKRPLYRNERGQFRRETRDERIERLGIEIVLVEESAASRLTSWKVQKIDMDAIFEALYSGYNLHKII